MPLPAISVIVSNFNGARFLPRLLETLHAQQGVTLEIIVVDRRSTDGSAEILAADPSVRVVSEPPDSGLVAGYSAGVVLARHPLVFFCNEDMWFMPDCLAKLAAHFSAHDVAAADPWQWTYDGRTLIHAGTRFANATNHQNGPDPDRRPDFFVPLASGDVIPFGCAGCVMVRRDVFDAVGGWDRSFFLDTEDLDLFIRVWQIGWRVVVEPEARVFHAVSVSNAKSLRGRVSVSRRRYISGRASVLVMALKYLPAFRIAWVLSLWLGATGNHLVTGRVQQARWDMGALRETLRRIPAAWQYRRQHRSINRRRPVAWFFRAREFQVTGAAHSAAAPEIPIAPRRAGSPRRFLIASDFIRDPDAGSAGGILDMGSALAGRGHSVDYLWSEARPYRLPHPFLSRWQELPRRQFRQIAAELERASYDVVIIFQPYAYMVYERLAGQYPDTLFLNGTYGWEDRLHRARLEFEWDGPFSFARRRGLAVTKALINRACRRTAHACHGLLTPTRRSAAYIRNEYALAAAKVAVVPIGLDEQFLAAPLERTEGPHSRMLYVGNYLPLKGSRVLEAILPAIAAKFPHATMTFVIQAHAVADVEARFRPYFGDRLTVLPWRKRDQMPEVYAQHDILLLTSFFEGFARVFLEAMSSGVCVVGFGVGGLPDLTKTGVEAFYCPPGDNAALQRLIERCLEDPAMTRAAGQRAHLRAKAFSSAALAEDIESFCEHRREAREKAAAR